MTILKSFLSLFAASALAACSSGGPGAPDGSTNNPAGPGDLPAFEEFDGTQALAAWRSALFKACDVESVFGLPPRLSRKNSPLLDLELLATKAQSGRRLQFGEHSLLVRHLVKPSGTAASSYTATATENGETRQVKLQVRQSGDLCEVFIGDRQLAKVRVAEAMMVFAHVRTGDVSTAFVEQNMPFEELASGFVRSTATALFPALITAFEPRYEELSRALGIPTEVARQTIRFERSTNEWRMQGRWSRRGAEPLPLFSARHPELLMPAQVARELNSPESRAFAIEWTFGEADGAPFPQAAKGADQLMTEFSLQPTATEGRPRLRVTRLFEPATRVFTDADRLGCARDRAKLLGAARPATVREAAAGPEELFEPCEAMGATAGLRVSAAALTQVLPAMIGPTEPSPEARFKDWDEAISLAILTSLDADQDPSVTLATKIRVPLVEALVNELRRLHRHAQEDPRVARHRSAYAEMVIAWARQGAHPDHRVLLRVLGATAPLIAELPQSVGLILQLQARQPGAEDRALRFSEQLDPDYAAAAREARLAMESAGDSRWLQLVYAQLLQLQVPREELERIALSVPRVGELLRQAPALQPFSAELHRLVLKNTAPEDFARLQTLARGLETVARVFPESTKAVLADALEDLERAQEALVFAGTLQPEDLAQLTEAAHAARVLELKDALALVHLEVLQRRPSPTERKTAAVALAAIAHFRQEDLRRVPSGLLADSERASIREVVQRAWAERWNDSVFSRLGSVVEPAQVGLARCKDASSRSAVMRCVGLDRFATKHPRLLSSIYGVRYVTLAAALVKISRRFSGSLANAMTAERLLRDFYGAEAPTWARCSDDAFASKLRELTEQVARLGGGLAEDTAAERAIRENQKDCL